MAERHSGYAKVAGDKFFTPFWVWDVLLEREAFEGPALEPAVGEIATAEYIEARLGYEMDYTDISLRLDFFDVAPGTYRSIITNPPWSNGLGARFVEHALAVTRPLRGKVAMLLPHGFDTALDFDRRSLFGDGSVLAHKIVITDRIRWRNLPQKKQGPSKVHCWYVFDHTHEGRAGTTYVYDADPSPEAVARRVKRQARWAEQGLVAA